MMLVKLFIAVCWLLDTPALFGERLDRYISHYEGLSYDTEALHNSHQRAKRALSPHDGNVHLDFHSHGRHFNLQMRRDTSVFSPDVIVDVAGEETPIDMSYIYSGELLGENGTQTHGSLINGRFDGFIKTHQGTYFVEPAERYFKEKNETFHSVIYHEDNITFPFNHDFGGHYANQSVFERMRKYQAAAVDEHVKWGMSSLDEEQANGPVILRRKRAAGKEKTVCQLFIQTDHLFHEFYKTREAVIAQISSHVKAIDSIYQATNFNGIRNIGFMVKRIKINTTANKYEHTNPFRFENIGVEKFLELSSEQNHNEYCLAYVFTNRDFDDGVLGLAWVADPSGISGGICEKHRAFADGKSKSLNTGIITMKNYGSHVPTKVSHITFAHEVGHNFGSNHDSGLECTPGESPSQRAKELGNYIMYARATSGDKLNNNKFSSCSIHNMSAVLARRKDSCFVESGQPICGNGLVEDGEECDCGYSDECEESCCYNANEPVDKRCKLLPGKVCSPSQGPCCKDDCSYKGLSDKCSEETDCTKEGMCSGTTASCLPAEPKENMTDCNGGTQVCLSGVCSGSICNKYGLEGCTCASSGKDEAAELCHVCCMNKTDPSTCSSSSSENWISYFQGKTITLQPGSPCNDFKGYCDVFQRCRLVDADGPLARLKKAIFNPEIYKTIAEWMADYWWAVLLMGIALTMLMTGFIKICSVHTPSSNPKLPPPKPLPGTLKRRRLQQANAHFSRNYGGNHQMAQMFI
ncbi:disintegrin and metalloproteinase domain-containing protein 10 [Dunckerocampus dactyliophorus]|uniref:disintegrin and metalloproteinase domain-containing protein 10 n=1 Tax=Dunckerocampus dactyliophorus TaxID=161453 RepID=UPI0024052F69|nr:disintegrin and metalloproteinase domain-containing protein 10 [Dunckerocampus dactyliophorus]